MFQALEPAPSYLTKVSKKLSPAEMVQDIRFKSTAGQDTYRDWTTGTVFNFWVGGTALIGLVAFLLQCAGRGRWRCNGFAWFAISMSLSPLMLLVLFGSVGQQYWQSRKPAKPHV